MRVTNDCLPDILDELLKIDNPTTRIVTFNNNTYYSYSVVPQSLELIIQIGDPGGPGTSLEVTIRKYGPVLKRKYVLTAPGMPPRRGSPTNTTIGYVMNLLRNPNFRKLGINFSATQLKSKPGRTALPRYFRDNSFAFVYIRGYTHPLVMEKYTPGYISVSGYSMYLFPDRT